MTGEIGAALREARRASRVTQVTVVAATGVSQSRLSRIENGRALPSEDEAAALARLYGLAPDETERLVRLAGDAGAEIHDSRLVIQRGNTFALQRRWRSMENDAVVVRSFQPAVVVGGLQSPAYAAAVMREPPDSEVVRDRMLRQERLRGGDRRLVAVHTEGALRRTVGSSGVMAEQLRHLIESSRRPNVELGVVPDRTPADFAVGPGFHVYDAGTVVVGVEVAAAILTDAEDVAHFRDLFERLRAVAVFGDPARAEMERIAAFHR